MFAALDCAHLLEDRTLIFAVPWRLGSSIGGLELQFSFVACSPIEKLRTNDPRLVEARISSVLWIGFSLTQTSGQLGAIGSVTCGSFCVESLNLPPVEASITEGCLGL